MGHWEDFYYNIYKTLNQKGLREKYLNQIEKMQTQDKHKYKTPRQLMEYAYKKIINGEEHKPK